MTCVCVHMCGGEWVVVLCVGVGGCLCVYPCPIPCNCVDISTVPAPPPVALHPALLSTTAHLEPTVPSVWPAAAVARRPQLEGARVC